MTCTNLDHIYPATVSGTPCHCGARRWNQDAPNYEGLTTKAKPATLPRRGATVTLLSGPAVV